jgi:iron complex outermembrane receptor protein
VNLSVQQSLSLGSWSLRAFFRVDNVLDKRYIGSVIVNESNGRFFEPAPGRSWTVGLDARY